MGASSSRMYWKNLNLEPTLLEWRISSDPDLRLKCTSDPDCPVSPVDGRCWGFEPNCEFNNSYSTSHIRCRKPSKWPGAQTKDGQARMFFDQGDFGYPRKVRESLQTICASDDKQSSFLECSDHLRFCCGRNIFFDFKSLDAKRSKRYRDDVIHAGEVGGRCSTLDKNLMELRADERSYLQSWGNKLLHFESYDTFSVDGAHCDVIFERPTWVIKLDASVNMYHHFCDFINLYASQFVNGSFSQDVDILWWDTHSGGFVDPLFGDTWKAFSAHKPLELVRYDKQKVCFRDVTFSLLARQRMGLYYNMPLVDGCSGSGLFHAFSRHVLYRLSIKQRGPLLDKVRITLLRRDTAYRRIENLDQIEQALRSLTNVEIRTVNFDRNVPFLEQLGISHNSDIFVGMHGSGLTHLLFLPDWAAVFEVYNCEDEHCYKDLARLRGVKYWTWSRADKIFPDGEGRHPTLKTPHKKFANYSFDVEEFVRLVKQMVEHVRRHPQFVQEQRKLRRLAAKVEL